MDRIALDTSRKVYSHTEKKLSWSPDLPFEQILILFVTSHLAKSWRVPNLARTSSGQRDRSEEYSVWNYFSAPRIFLRSTLSPLSRPPLPPPEFQHIFKIVFSNLPMREWTSLAQGHDCSVRSHWPVRVWSVDSIFSSRKIIYFLP